MKQVIIRVLNVLHFIYCWICFCALDTPLLFRWDWYYWIIYYLFTLPLFIWGLVRVYQAYDSEVKEE